MATSKAISFGRLIVKNLHTINVSTRTPNTKLILNDPTRFRMLPSTTTALEARRAFCNLSGNQELPPPPPPPPSSPWSSNGSNRYRLNFPGVLSQCAWSKLTAGIAVTTVISLLQFKEDVDLVMGTAEEVLEVVEVVAEAVDMVAEKISDDLLDGSKLKTTVEVIEEVAETVAGKAQKVVDFIDEVQEAEQKLNPIIEPVKQITQVAPSEDS